jgi:hypothetical protein
MSIKASGLRSVVLATLAFCTIFFAGFLTASLIAQDNRPARLYFVRHSTLVGIINSPEIKIDGRSVGSISTGSYIFVERPPGRHTIVVSHWADFGQFVADVHVNGGESYYYEIAIATRGGGGVLLPSLAGEVGRPMKARVDSGSYRLNVLDPKAGAASVLKLKR